MTDWRTTRLDRVVRVGGRTVQPEHVRSPEVFHYSIPVLDETGDGRVEPSAELGSSKILLRGGELLLSKLNPRKARVLIARRIDDLPCVCSGEFIVLEPEEIHPRFLLHLMTSETVRQYLDSAVQSVTRSHQRIRPEHLIKMWIQLPSPRRQRAIADFLDAETARIDALIAGKRRMGELLLEQRAAITLQGVGGALTHDEPVTDSPLPWLEQSPSHWKSAMVKLVASLGTGHTPSREHPDWWVDTTIPWITTGEVAQMRDDRIEEIVETREQISPLGIANSSAVVHRAGTVALSRTASAGFSAIMGRDMATSQDFVTWTCGPLLEPRYLLLCLRAMRRDLLERLAMGSTHKTIYMPDVQSIRVPLPPLAEQHVIVEIVWGRLRRIDKIRDLLDQEMGLLQERRRTLIASAVTGQIPIPA